MLDESEIFVEVVKAGSLSGAARATGVPVSTISDRIAHLEARLQTVLLKRTTRRLVLTEAGRTYFAVASRALDDIGGLEAELVQAAPYPAGTLRLASTLAMDRLLAPILSAFLHEHPRVAIELFMNARTEDLIGGSYDLAIRLGALPDDSGLIARTLGRWAVQLVASPGYLAKAPPIRSPRDLVPADILCFTGTATLDLHRPDGASARIVPAPRFSSNQMSSILLQALSGNGVALLPTAFLDKELEEGSLVVALPDWSWDDLPVSAVYPRHKVMPAKVRAFLDLLVARFPKDIRGSVSPAGRKVSPVEPG